MSDIAEIFTWLSALICSGVMISALFQRERLIEFRFAAMTVFLFFVVLPLYGYIRSVPDGTPAVATYSITTFLCILATNIGDRLGRTRSVAPGPRLDERDLVGAAIVLLLMGGYFFSRIGSVSDTYLLEGSQLTGVAVAYNFFAQTVKYAFAIATVVYLRFKSGAALALALLALALYSERIFLAGRRGDAADLVAIMLISAWFYRGWLPGRLISTCAIVATVLLLFSTGDYRRLVAGESGLSNVGEIDFWENASGAFATGSSEITTGIRQVEVAQHFRAFDYGLEHWNRLIDNYVPAQLVGTDVKQSLMVRRGLPSIDALGYQTIVGSTRTGVATVFCSFGYFGAIEFGIVAFIMRRIYSSAVAGSAVARFSYMLMFANALHCITHHTSWFVTPWVHLLIFFYPAILYARRRAKRRQSLGTLRAIALGN